jgi:hypothetical protein
MLGLLLSLHPTTPPSEKRDSNAPMKSNHGLVFGFSLFCVKSLRESGNDGATIDGREESKGAGSYVRVDADLGFLISNSRQCVARATAANIVNRSSDPNLAGASRKARFLVSSRLLLFQLPRG